MDEIEKAEPAEGSGHEIPKNALKGMLQELEVSFMRNRGGNGLDMSVFDSGQKDKLLSILEKNEDNAYKYHTRRLEVQESITKKHIDASIVNQRTTRFTIIGMIILFLVVTVVILCLKETFFIPWLTFTAGLIGGSGITKVLQRNDQENKIPNLPKDDDD